MVQREIKRAKSEYFKEKIEENKNNPKKLWQSIKEIGLKSKSGEAKLCLNIDDVICHDPKTISDSFVSFFTNVASSLVAKLPACRNIYSVSSECFKSFYSSRNMNKSQFVLKPVSEDFIYKELTCLNPSKSTGLDEIPARFIKDGAYVLKIPITFIVNLSITSGEVPEGMKIARVKPLYKKNSPLDVGNYRPVSILSIVSKILERSVHLQLSNFLSENNLLFEFQSGFRDKYSTDTCLIHLLDHIRDSNSKGLFTGMVMLDLQKAFDTVDHSILCKKLEVLGVSSVAWFKSYLSDRKQYVCVSGATSSPGFVSCGVPQGSILGPLLFLIYVNDMSLSIDDDCKLILYADDSAILFSHNCVDYISKKLGKVLESCSDWLVDNKLSLHLGKTECMLFGPKNKLSKIDHFSIVCKEHVIKASQQVKYLGLYIDARLCGESIVTSIVQKVNSRLKFLYRQARFLDQKSKFSLCSALILCHLDYSSSSWYCGLSKTLKRKLQICQNKVFRFILDLSPKQSVNSTVFDTLNMLNVERRVKQMRLNHVFNIVHNTAPIYLRQNFTTISHHYCNTRSANCHNFIVPSIKQCQDKTFYYNAIKDWNGLPLNIKQIKSKTSFKHSVKKYLMEDLKRCEESSFVYF